MIAIDQDTDVLGLIDVQPTFMPGGELAVPEGDAVVAPINRLLRQIFAHAFATQDWHPPGHVSFASTHGAEPFSTITLPYGDQTLWPDHGLIGTPMRPCIRVSICPESRAFSGKASGRGSTAIPLSARTTARPARGSMAG